MRFVFSEELAPARRDPHCGGLGTGGHADLALGNGTGQPEVPPHLLRITLGERPTPDRICAKRLGHRHAEAMRVAADRRLVSLWASSRARRSCAIAVAVA